MTEPPAAILMSKRPSLRRKAPRRTADRVAASTPAHPIVGIGASAGGLEALEQFFLHVPEQSGMAFVVVQHLDPTHPGIMAELLQRFTPMKVAQVRDGTRVRPDHVYVIPPNKDMSILGDTLHLFAPSAPRGLRLPIDFFLRSLALERRERSIGVILSGMGSDGTLGLRAIREVAGLGLAQTPATAKFDDMPRSAVDAGVADIVAPAGELPRRIVEFGQRAVPLARTEVGLEDKTRRSLEKAVILLRARSGHDFSLYKRNTLYRRIERRMGIHQINQMAAYVRYLQENPQELDLLFKEMLIGVTNFFRDPNVWTHLSEKVWPALFARHASDHIFRAWIPACSTGEEAYSLAITFREALERAQPEHGFSLQIFATDLDRDAIDRARQGSYPTAISADVSAGRLKRFFSREDHGYRVRSEIRGMVIFAPQNLIMDPPFTKLDLLCCRNLLIYLGPEVQRKLIPLFHYSLVTGGILLLGSAETIGSDGHLFEALNGKLRLYQRAATGLATPAVEFPATFSARTADASTAAPASSPAPTLQSVADQLLLQHHAPPAVIVNDRGDIHYINGRTGRYLEPAAGKANWNLFAMTRESLRGELAEGFQRALRQTGEVTLSGLRTGSDANDPTVNIVIRRLDDTPPLRGLILVIFLERPAVTPLPPASAKGRSRNPRVAELQRELLHFHAETRASNEQMQTSQEELRSTNEEMQSTVEELQSTNEELTTSKEEMQSLNEELQTLNTELQSKVDELSQASSDMKNLLDSTDIATLFLDQDLRVRRYTPQATRIIKLIPGDIGRPITDLVSDLNYPTLAADVDHVLTTLVSTERAAGTQDGRWFNLRIMPYRKMDDCVDGVVITFADVTEAKTLEAKLRSRHARLEKHVASQHRKAPRKRR